MSGYTTHTFDEERACVSGSPGIGAYRSMSSTQPVEVVGDLRGDEQPVAGTELGESPAGTEEFLGPFLQVTVDLSDRPGKPVGVGGKQLLDAGERHAGLGERSDLDQVDGMLGSVTPVARRVTRRLGDV
jgi:hypothetical protein